MRLRSKLGRYLLCGEVAVRRNLQKPKRSARFSFKKAVDCQTHTSCVFVRDCSNRRVHSDFVPRKLTKLRGVNVIRCIE